MTCKACGKRIQPGELVVELKTVTMDSRNNPTTGRSEYIHYRHIDLKGLNK